MELRAGDCRWIEHGTGVDAIYCADTVVPTRSYCRCHLRMVYQQAPEPGSTWEPAKRIVGPYTYDERAEARHHGRPAVDKILASAIEPPKASCDTYSLSSKRSRGRRSGGNTHRAREVELATDE